MKNSYTFQLENVLDNMNSNGVFLTSGTEDNANTMTVSWGSVGYMWGKPVFIVIVSDIRYTKEFIDKENTFTISVPDNNMSKALYICGHNSGREADKVTLSGIKFQKGKYCGSPIVKGCNRYYECRVVLKQKFDLSKIDNKTKYKPGEEEHTMYFGEILGAY